MADLRVELAQVILEAWVNADEDRDQAAADAVLALLREKPLSEVVQTLGYSWAKFDLSDGVDQQAAVASITWTPPPTQRKVMLVDLGGP